MYLHKDSIFYIMLIITENNIYFKVPHYAILKITFHAVCNIAVFECKMSYKFLKIKVHNK